MIGLIEADVLAALQQRLIRSCCQNGAIGIPIPGPFLRPIGASARATAKKDSGHRTDAKAFAALERRDFRAPELTRDDLRARYHLPRTTDDIAELAVFLTA